MTHQELKDLLPLYVVGGLDAESIAEVEYHLDTDCDSCPDELREWREVAGLIPLGTTLDGPNAGVKERLLQRVRQENVAKVIPLRLRRWRALGLRCRWLPQPQYPW